MKRVKSSSIQKTSKKDKTSISDKRKAKEESKNGNKGLIASCLTLASVGMVNFMGQTNNVCVPGTGFDEVAENADFIIQDTPMTVMGAKRDLVADDTLSQYQTQWENDYEKNSIIAQDDVYGSIVDLTPGNPDDLTNHSAIFAGKMSLEEAYMAHDIRESFLQRHVSQMAAEAEVTELQTGDFKAKINKTWRA